MSIRGMNGAGGAGSCLSFFRAFLLQHLDFFLKEVYFVVFVDVRITCVVQVQKVIEAEIISFVLRMLVNFFDKNKSWYQCPLKFIQDHQVLDIFFSGADIFCPLLL